MNKLVAGYLHRLTFLRQLGIATTLGIFLLALMSSMVSSWQSNVRVRKDMTEQGHHLAESLARQSSLALLVGSSENARDAIRITMSFPEVIGVALYQQDGSVLFSRGFDRRTKPARQTFAPPPSSLSATKLQAEDENTWLFSAPVYTQPSQLEPFGPVSDPEFLGHVELLISKQPMKRLSAEIFASNLVISLSFALLFLLLVRTLSRNMARPLDELSASMARARLGEPGVRAQPGGPTDIATMAHAFNNMMAVLDERESALRGSEEKYRTLVESAMSIILRWNMHGTITYINPYAENLFGFQRGELLGRHVVGTIVPETESTSRDLSAMINGILTNPDRHRINVNENIRKNGERLWVVWSNHAILDKSGNMIEILSVGNDITERKRAEDALTESMHQLQEKEMAKSRFLAAAGHDLRQPLAAANLFIDALKFTGPTEQQDKLIQQLDHAMSTFNGLLDALLNISKLDAGIVQPQLEPIALADIFSWLEQNFRPIAEEKGLELRLHWPRQRNLAIYGDFGLLKSILMNLVSNAIKFTPFGAILVAARRRGNDILFQVLDNGPGIPESSIDFIFDEFYQVNNPQRDRTRGLGLGLAIVKRSLALLDRRIACRSIEGAGSRFEFALPIDSSMLKQNAQTSLRHEDGKPAEIEFAKGKRFIVVDDDMLVGQAMIDLLSGMGGDVTHFHRPENALHSPESGNADYYIVDYMLGGSMNGIELLEQIRAKADKPVRAVLVTGDTSTGFIRETENCRWPILHKPVNLTRLLSSLGA